MTFNIQFDYRYDSNGFFNNPQQRAALEAAADLWENLILDEFPNIPAGTSIIAVNPEDLSPLFPLRPVQLTLDYEIDDLVIFVGGETRSLSPNPFQETLALGTFIGSSNDPRLTGSDFQPSVGAITFNPRPRGGWFFDSTPDTTYDIPDSQTDFIGAAAHEIGHVLGIGAAPIFRQLGAGSSFNGNYAKSLNQGQPIPLTSDLIHVQQGFTLPHGTTSLSTAVIDTVRPTLLDAAFLADIGYEIPSVSGGQPVATAVYRFFNTVAGGHFFTVNEAERDFVRNNYPQYQFEGVGFYASATPQDDLLPVYRFYNTVAGGHFFTTNTSERDFVQNNYPQYQFEGIGFYTYGSNSQDTNLGLDVYRFYNIVAGGHFFTTSASERESVINNYPQFVFEGVGFEALP